MDGMERVYGPGTRFKVKEGSNHSLFVKDFEITDQFRDGSTFFKMRNPEGASEPFERTAIRTTQQVIHAQVANGTLCVEGDEFVVPSEEVPTTAAVPEGGANKTDGGEPEKTDTGEGEKAPGTTSGEGTGQQLAEAIGLKAAVEQAGTADTSFEDAEALAERAKNVEIVSKADDTVKGVDATNAPPASPAVPVAEDIITIDEAGHVEGAETANRDRGGAGETSGGADATAEAPLGSDQSDK